MTRLKIQYFNEEERQNIIDDNSSLFLIEEHNILEGNFLLFSDTEPIRELSEIEVLKNTILELSDELSGGIL